MKKSLKLVTGLVTTTGIGIVGTTQTVQAEELTNVVKDTVQPEALSNQSKEVVKGIETQISNQTKVVNDKQLEVDTNQKQLDKVNQEVSQQQKVVSDNQSEVINQEANVANKKEQLEEAEKTVNGATEALIDKQKEQVLTDQNKVVEQEKNTSSVKEQATEVQKSVDTEQEKVKKVTEQNKKDQEAKELAEKNLRETEELSKNADSEKIKVGKDQAIKEKNLSKSLEEAKKAKELLEKETNKLKISEKNIGNLQSKIAENEKLLKTKNEELVATESLIKKNQENIMQIEKDILAKKGGLEGDRGIIFPEKFTPDYYKKLNKEEIKVLEESGNKLNSDYPSSSDDNVKKNTFIDMNNISKKQKEYMSNYFVGLLNDARKKLGLFELKVSNQAISFAWDVAKKSDPNMTGHDVVAINNSAKEHGLLEYVGANLYENAGFGYLRFSDNKFSEYDFERQSRRLLVSMIFNDEKSSYGHLASLLGTRSTHMAVAISKKNTQYASQIHILSFDKGYVTDESKFDEGKVPEFISESNTQEEIDILNLKLSNLKTSQDQIIKERDSSKLVIGQIIVEQSNLKGQIDKANKSLKETQTNEKQAKAAYEQKIEQTQLAKADLKKTNETLKMINDLIENRESVLQVAKNELTAAIKVEEQSSGKLNRAKLALQKEESKLVTWQHKVITAENELKDAKEVLAKSVKALSLSENAEYNYNKVAKEVEEAEKTLEKAKLVYDESVKKITDLESKKQTVSESYKLAKDKLKEAKKELVKFEKELKIAEENLAEEIKKEELNNLVEEEQGKLNKEDKTANNNKQVNLSWKKPTKVNEVRQVKLSSNNTDNNFVVRSMAIGNKILPQTNEKSIGNYLVSLLGVFLFSLGFVNPRKKLKED